jgi:hypothetical protein
MKRYLLMVILSAAATVPLAHADVGQVSEIGQVYDDAKAIDRFAEASKRGDLPKDVIERIVEQDIDFLRRKRPDGTFQYASYERVESGRIGDNYSIQPSDDNDHLTKVDLRGDFVYRLIVEVPSRRMIVTKNRKLWLDRVEVEYIPQSSSTSKSQTVKVGQWLAPGDVKTFELPEVGRQATLRVWMRADKKDGYGNVSLTLLKARVADNPDSPYARVVANERALLKALDFGDTASIRNLAGHIRDDLASTGGVPAADTSAPPRAAEPAPPPPYQGIDQAQVVRELQAIEDLVTGTESERREGLDRLHQLLRKMRQ